MYNFYLLWFLFFYFFREIDIVFIFGLLIIKGGVEINLLNYILYMYFIENIVLMLVNNLELFNLYEYIVVYESFY